MKKKFSVFGFLGICVFLAGAAHAQGAYALGNSVFTGRAACEDGVFVDISKDPKSAGGYWLLVKGSRYWVSQVPTMTGTVRLEDAAGRMVWIQIDDKSMLLDSEMGQRVADECRVPYQQNHHDISTGLAAPKSLID